MSSITSRIPASAAAGPVAPWWHTLLVLVPLAAGSVASYYQNGLANMELPGMNSRFSSYVTVLLQEWCVVLLIWLALKHRGLSISTLIAGRWQTMGAFFRDMALAVGFLIVAVPLVGILAYLLGGNALTSISNILPKTALELLVFLGLAATGGFCEELIFRGYLTQQFRAWTGSVAFAIILQGVVFGLAHGYYAKIMIVIMIQGWLLGTLAHWRKSLLPGMLAHGLQDSFAGVVAFFS